MGKLSIVRDSVFLCVSLVTLAAWLHDPDRVLVGTTQAMERARARGAAWVEPDDLLAGMLLAIARFGIVDLGERVIDLSELEPGFDLPPAELAVRPRYTPAAAAVFERAARVARADGEVRLTPNHLLVVLGDHSIPTFARIAVLHGIDPTGWRRLLSCIAPPRSAVPARTEPPPAPLVGFGALVPQDEAARALGVTLNTLRAYVRAGKLTAFRVPGDHPSVRIRRDDLVALLALLRAIEHPMPARRRDSSDVPVESSSGEPVVG
jgi:excisionase family DNA binding protein